MHMVADVLPRPRTGAAAEVATLRREAQMVFQSALTVFVFTVVIGILNGAGIVSFELCRA